LRPALKGRKKRAFSGMLRKIVPYVILVLLAIVLLCAHLLYKARAISDTIPPPGVLDLASYLAEMPDPELAFEVQIGASRFLEAHGPPQPLMALPSGPPAYVFDEAGALVDWTSDVGDDSTFSERWHRAGTRRLLDPEELEELIQTTRE
jgi:hypothetical protein